MKAFKETKLDPKDLIFLVVWFEGDIKYRMTEGSDLPYFPLVDLAVRLSGLLKTLC